MTRNTRFRPFAARGRFVIGAIVATFFLFSTLSVALSFLSRSRSSHSAAIVEVAARQRTMAERYVNDVLLRQQGLTADPSGTAAILVASARALLDGGVAPAVNGDDDAISVPRSSGADLRAQIAQEGRLAGDLTRTGAAVLAGRSVLIPLHGHEHLAASDDPVQRLRILEALTSNVALNVARSIAQSEDSHVNSVLDQQLALSGGGFLLSLLLGWGLVRATRRQTAHFKSLITASSDLVLVLGPKGCRYASATVVSLLGVTEEELLGDGFVQHVHDEDRTALAAATREPSRLLFRVRTAAGDWRHLDAHVNDLREDRQLQGVVVNARDVSERVALERELTDQARRDTFSAQLVEALEMADDETDAYAVVERAMVELAPASPMELLLSDSSRAHLERAAASPTSGAPGCPVESPFSCVAVRRGHPVVFESSEALNACPKLRDRPEGSCSAVCVPISFMGRALGVLHSTGPDGEPLDRERIAQLTTLATQAGTRIGTVRAFERTQLQASTDDLTGLDNRRNLEKQLRRLIVQRRPFAFALGDLDHFKLLNDKHGHEAGDRALRLFAQVALDALREEDMIGRWGGEEFVIVLPDVDRTQALTILDRLRQRLAASHTGEHPRFTASFGVTDSTRAGTVQELVQLADAALYTAKVSGRDQAWADSGLTPAPGGRDGASPADPRSENGYRVNRSRTRLLADDGAEDDARDMLGLR